MGGGGYPLEVRSEKGYSALGTYLLPNCNLQLCFVVLV